MKKYHALSYLRADPTQPEGTTSSSNFTLDCSHIVVLSSLFHLKLKLKVATSNGDLHFIRYQ